MKLKENVAKYLRKKITDPDYAFEVQKDDVFLVSYPKSGNTWMRFLLANTLNKEDDVEINLDNLNNFVPDIYQVGRENIKKNLDLSIFKTHSYFRPKYANNKVVYIVRNVRDVCVSYFFYKRRKNEIIFDFNKFFELFLDGNIDSFGDWGLHVGSWIGAMKGRKNFLLIKYENILRNPEKEILKVLNFLGLKRNKAQIIKAINLSNIKNLRKVEKKTQDKKYKKLKGTFFRKGKKNDWKNYFSNQQSKKIDSKFGIVLDELNYKNEK